jgi:bifunctional DNA-binding transcriptional regulator/antitoxin component of YhaV-PrlF toxin-antitoxin module
MPAAKPLSRLVRPRSKGQITLPIEFRRCLNIDDKTILSLSLKGSKVEILPLRPLPEQALLRGYTSDEIQWFLKEDQLDPHTAKRVRRLLGRHA